MKHNYQLFILSLIFISQSIFGQNYVIQEIPEWVKKIDIPIESSVSKYDISSGYYLTLVDYQSNTDKQAIFSHEVINVVSYSGITAASQLSVSYDTTFQKLLLHHLYIWRKGKKIDRTSDLSFELLNSEDQLQQGIYTGQITAYDILNDIRKDDMIDFAYTLVGHNPIFENEKYMFFPLQMLNPIDLLNVRILFPKDKDYQYECVDCNSMDYSISNIEDYKVIEIKNENVKAIELEDFIPTWELPYKYFILSSFHSWAEVNMWAQRVFALNNDPDLDTVFNEIFTGEETTSNKINKIIDFVQDEIRYMGIESGMGSIKPFPPEQVVIQRFGDCKDKSLLLVSLLKKIGINTAYPVLVNTYMQQNVDKLFISNEVFNHTIVRFDYNDTTYWVDPTFAQQGGDFRDLYTPDYGKVLVIGMPADILQTMSPVNRESGLIVTEEYFIKSFTEPSELKITSHRYGFEADQRRAVMEFFSTKDISDMIIKDMKLLFPMVNKKGEIEIADDLNNNTFTINYLYELDGYWEKKDVDIDNKPRTFWIFTFEPIGMYQYLKSSDCEDRKFDLQQEYPTNLDQKLIFHFPKDLIFMDDFHVFDNEAFYFDEKIEQLDSKTLLIEYHYKTKSKFIKATDYKEICDQKKITMNGLPIIFYFDK